MALKLFTFPRPILIEGCSFHSYMCIPHPWKYEKVIHTSGDASPDTPKSH